MQLDAHYTDPRLVSLYDENNPRGSDYDFYIQLAREIQARKILDLGCGTGLLTRELASHGWQVTGIDPAPAMLAYARQQADADTVTWLEGDSSQLGKPNADLIVMTGNVAQVFLEDADWLTTLQHSHAALRSGGYLAFESRNPSAKAWQHWQGDASYSRRNTPYGVLEEWLELVEVSEGKVHFQAHNFFVDTGEKLVVDSILRFRSQQEIRASLHEAGFAVQHVYGNWQREAVKETSPLLIFVAQRSEIG